MPGSPALGRFLRRTLAQPLRTLLLLLQIVLSTLAITVAIGAYRSSTGAGGPAERFDLMAATQGERFARPYPLFAAGDLQALLLLAPTVEAIALFSEHDEPTVELGEEHFMFRAAAVVSPQYFSMADLAIVAGSAFTQPDLAAGGRFLVISRSAAHTLFPADDAVGRELRMLPTRVSYRIIGVFEAVGGSADQPAVFLSHNISGFEGAFNTLKVLARPGEAAAAREQLLAAARRVHSAELSERGLEPGQDFIINGPGSSAVERGRMNLELIIFGLLGIITLIVGAIGIFSITVVEALERQRDIGLLRALGATRFSVGLEFMRDSAVLAALGSALGVGLTMIVLPQIQPDTADQLFGGKGLAFDPAAALMAFALVVLLAAILTLVPALQAGSLPPVEALREP